MILNSCRLKVPINPAELAEVQETGPWNCGRALWEKNTLKVHWKRGNINKPYTKNKTTVTRPKNKTVQSRLSPAGCLFSVITRRDCGRYRTEWYWWNVIRRIILKWHTFHMFLHQCDTHSPGDGRNTKPNERIKQIREIKWYTVKKSEFFCCIFHVLYIKLGKQKQPKKSN